MKKVFLHGIISGVLAGAVSYIYNIAYSEALLVDFSSIINTGAVFGACIFGCVLASLGYHFTGKIITRSTDVWFNILFLLISFASFISPFAVSLPLDIESPELFIGLTIPMHVFPMLFWLAVKPLFNKVGSNI